MVSVRVAAIAINGRNGVDDDGDRCSSNFIDHLFPVQLAMAKKEQERAAAVEDDAQEQVLDFNGEIIVANIDHPCMRKHSRLSVCADQQELVDMSDEQQELQSLLNFESDGNDSGSNAPSNMSFGARAGW